MHLTVNSVIEWNSTCKRVASNVIDHSLFAWSLREKGRMVTQPLLRRDRVELGLVRTWWFLYTMLWSGWFDRNRILSTDISRVKNILRDYQIKQIQWSKKRVVTWRETDENIEELIIMTILIAFSWIPEILLYHDHHTTTRKQQTLKSASQCNLSTEMGMWLSEMSLWKSEMVQFKYDFQKCVCALRNAFG